MKGRQWIIIHLNEESNASGVISNDYLEKQFWRMIQTRRKE
jgi:hypothetical protein